MATVTVDIPEGSNNPNDKTKTFTPTEITIGQEDTIKWKNLDKAAHTVTSGKPGVGPDGKFDSSIFLAKSEFSQFFAEPGTYDYFCMVHPWKTGKIIVQ